MNSSIERYQKQLLDRAIALSITYETPITEATQKAYLATPRHLFVKRYHDMGVKEWSEVTEDNLAGHLANLYRDGGLALYEDENGDVVSTISQPSLVLMMLDMLQLEAGQSVFELGAASGWNAALLGHLVGPEGHIYSVEIIPEMACTAVATIEQLGIKNVSIIEGDGGEGYAKEAPYDRAVFTAGAYDVPRCFFEQIKNGGLLLIVIKNEGGGDNLFLLLKMSDHFESLKSMTVGFVQMTGKHQMTDLDPVILEDSPEWTELKARQISTRGFWWGMKGKEQFAWKTLGIRSFLSITEPLFKTFKTKKTNEKSVEEQYFGLWDKENCSLVIAKDDTLTSYGSPAAEQRLVGDIRTWVNLGMPNAASFNLKVYPSDVPLKAAEDEWIVRRNEAQLLWSLRT